MAKRTLADLQRQYASTGKDGHGGMPRGRGPGHGPGRGGPPGGMGGKPKNTKNTISRLLKYLLPYSGYIGSAFACILLNTIATLVGGYMLMPIIDKLAGTPAASTSAVSQKAAQIIGGVQQKLLPAIGELGDKLSFVVAGMLVMACAYAVGIVTAYLRSRLMLSVSQGTLAALRKDLFDKVQTLPVRFFDSRPTGEIMSRFTNDVDNVGMMLDHSLVELFAGIIKLAGTVFFMVTTNWMLTLITVLFVPVFFFGGAAIAKRSRKYYSGQQAALGAVNGYIEETVTGQKVIKVFNHEDTCVEEFGLLNNDLREKQFKAQFYGGIMGPIMHNTSLVSYAITIGVGGILIFLGRLSVGGLTLFANYSKEFSFPINMLSQQMTTVFSALAGAERVFAVMDTDSESADAPNAKSTEGLQGFVKFEEVTFGYNPDKTILKNISLYAKPGQKIAFVGSTGAGKTTVTNLINRFYDIDQGRITIDDVDIRDYKREELRKNIAMVLQDTHLFTGTVMENIRYGRLDATDEEVIEAAKTASAHSFIMRLSDGYDTVIEGDGSNLSQGQRQLLNIARAAVSKAPILILDEATSSVDTRTERHIEKGLDRLMQGRTTFVIAHRLSTVRNANAIMVLEQGEIIERGDHDDLLAQKGRYYQLYTGAVELD